MRNIGRINSVRKLRNELDQSRDSILSEGDAVIETSQSWGPQEDSQVQYSNTSGAGNLFDNPAFEITQKGIGAFGAGTPPGVYGADRWCTEAVNSGATAGVTHGVLITTIAGQSREYRLSAEGVDTGYLTFGQMLDPGVAISGRNVTISMEVKIDASAPTLSSSATVNFSERSDSGYLRDGTTYFIADLNKFDRDVWYKFSITVPLLWYTDYVHYGLSFRDLGITTSGHVFYIRNPQLFIGDRTPLYSKPNSSSELYKCYRHYYTSESTSAIANTTLWRGDVTSGSSYISRVVLPRGMWKIPTITLVSSAVTGFNAPYTSNLTKETFDLIAEANTTSPAQHFQSNFTAAAEYFP